MYSGFGTETKLILCYPDISFMAIAVRGCRFAMTDVCIKTQYYGYAKSAFLDSKKCEVSCSL